MRPNLPNVQMGPLDTSGRWLQQWVQFFRGLVATPGPLATVVLGPTPATVTAADDGHYLVTAGTSVGITLQRGRESRATGLSAGLIPVSQGDSLSITYSAAPTVTFIPS